MGMFDNMMGVYQSALQGMGGLANLYGGYQGMQNANQVNNQVQPALAQNSAASQAQIDSLTNQINTSRQQAQDMYQRSLGDVTSQNTGIQGNIDTLTSSLNALSDPNSAYMQQARQAIERKDAAAGRNSQWGDREVQLAGTLADYVGKYSPGLSGQITAGRNQISQNNQGLANLYNLAQQPGDRETLAQIEAIKQQMANANAANTIGRGAANSATNNTTGMLQGAGQALGGLGGLFQQLMGTGIGYSGGNGSGGGTGYEGLYGWGGDTGLGQGMGFTGGGIDTDYLGLAGNSSLDQGMMNYNPYGYTSMIGGGGGYEAPLDFNDPSSGWWD